jgi:DNA-binding transcriptional LysR family regulator
MDGVTDVMPRPILKLSSLTMVRDAVHTGVGAALLPLSMVTKDIVRGTLARWAT